MRFGCLVRRCTGCRSGRCADRPAHRSWDREGGSDSPLPPCARIASRSRFASTAGSTTRSTRRLAADHRLRAAGAGRIQAGDREDRGVDLLRRRQHLHVGAQLGNASRSAASPTRCGATPPSCGRTTPSACCSTPSTTSATATSSTPTRSAASPTARSPTKARPTSTGTRCGTCAPANFDGGWTIEMAIPFKSLRYQPGTDQMWGVNLRRVVRWKNEWSYLAQVPRALTTFRGLLKISSAGNARGPAGAVGQHQPRAEAVRARRRLHRQHRDAARRQRSRRPHRRRREVRHHAEHHRRPHRQHRLRAGRGR